MNSFDTARKIAHSADNMYALVADVERYPEFVPLCGGLKVTSREGIAGGEQVLADMTAGYKAFRETFRSRVTLQPAKRKILVEYVDGPFRHLENRWSFAALGERACEVSFFIEYEFRSRTLQLVAGAVFEHGFRRFVYAFEGRADALYGKTNSPTEAKL